MNEKSNLVEAISKKLIDYRPISLDEMDTVKLMNRTDTKFFFHANLLNEILAKAMDYYRVLEINNLRQFSYLTTYFDTPDFLLYGEHQKGKLNRYKIRQRRYDVTGTEFFEVKFKTNKGRTLKSRIENNDKEFLNEKTDSFLKKKTPYNISLLEKAIRNEFIRITLVNNDLTERATLDYNLSFSNFSQEFSCPSLGIAEIKQDNNSGPSMILQIMKELRVRPQGISKYCFGVANLFPNIKNNRFKPQILKINNL